MIPVRKTLLLLLILAFPLHHLFAQDSLRRIVKNPIISKEFYKNGNLKSVTKIKTQVPRNSDLFNYYKKTKVVRTVYDSITGRKKMFSVRITKAGVGGKHCYEYFYKKIDYDDTGKRTRFEKSSCDKNRYKFIIYKNWKKDFIHIERKRVRKR